MTGPLQPIQIWQPEDDAWHRQPQGTYGDHHAARQTLHKRRGPEQRLVLVGESVAAGYLFAPHFTPALALDGLLADWDVIDLARTNESLESLEQTVHGALQLEPDVIVMWAGNNWMLRDMGALSPYHRDSLVRRELGRVLADDGPGGVQTFAEQQVRSHVMPKLAAIAETLAAAGVRLIVVVPEVNLVDWHHDQPVTVLPSGDEAAWNTANAAHDHDLMYRLDQGSCATTHRLRARTQNGDEATRSLRREVAASAGPFRGCTSSPMATLQIQDLLREWAMDYRLALVDLPDAIASRGTPDRHWFLDYCHHTAPAINTIASLIASTVDADHGGPITSVEPELVAVAALGALLHTDHRLVGDADRLALLRHLREHAMRAWNGTPELVRDIIESRLGQTPIPLTAAQRRNSRRPYPFGFAHGWRPHTSEADALAVLGLSDSDLRELVMSAERSWPPERIARPGQIAWHDEQASEHGVGYFRAIRPTSAFTVRILEAHPLRVELTARSRNGGHATLGLGEWSETISLTDRWTTHQFMIAPDVVPTGLHVLRLRWPELAESDHRWHTALSHLQEDRSPELHPIFGEVHSLKVN